MAQRTCHRGEFSVAYDGRRRNR